MNFSVATLIVKTEEKESIFWLYYFKKGENTTEMQKQICAMYGEGAMTGLTGQKWFVKFHARDFSLDDTPWSSRPVEVDRDQIETLIENNHSNHARDSQHTQSIQIKCLKSFAQAWLCSLL